MSEVNAQQLCGGHDLGSEHFAWLAEAFYVKLSLAALPSSAEDLSLWISTKEYDHMINDIYKSNIF